MRQRRLENLVDASTLILSTLFLISYFEPSLLFTETVIAGGDSLSHYFTAHYLKSILLPKFAITGWAQGNYAGFPLLLMYFPLSFLLSDLLSLLMPLAVAFKLVTASGTFLLPFAAYAFLRLLRFPFPAPALGAVSTLAFLFVESNGMWGGNIPSTLAGEFAHSLSLALMLPCLGLVYRGVAEGRHIVKIALLAAAMGMTHACPLIFFAFACPFFLLRRRDFVSGGLYLLKAGIAAFMLLGVWIVPFLWSLQYSTTFTFNWVFGSIKEVLPPVLLPLIALSVICSAALLIRGRLTRDPTAGPLGFLWYCVVLGGVLYYIAPSIGIVDIRFLPFSHLFLALIGAAAAAACCRDLKAGLAVPLLFFCAVAAWVSSMTAYIPDRIQFNYSGMEAKPLWKSYREVNDILAGSVKDPRVVYEHSDLYRKAGGIRAFELLPLFSGRNTLEGLYLQSSLSSPFVFYIQSEISEKASWPFIGYNYSRLDLRKGIEHLKMFNVRHFIAVSDRVRGELLKCDGVRLVKEVPPFAVYELSENLDRYVVPLANAPVLMGRKNWRRISYNWFRQGDREVHVVFGKGKEEDGKGRFERGFPGRVSGLPKRALPPTDIGRIRETVSEDEVIFHTPYRNLPHLIRISYHPNWKVEGADRIYLVSPSFMLVYPQRETVRLYYGRSFPDDLGACLTIGGILFLVFLRMRPLKTPLFVEKHGDALHKAFLVTLACAGGALILFSDHRDPYVMHNKGQAYFQKEAYEKARAQFAAAMKRFPVSPVIDDTMVQYAFCFFREKRWQETIEALQALLDRFPETRRAAEAIYHIGLCRQSMGENKDAVQYYHTVIAEFPDSRWAAFAKDRLREIQPAS